MNSHNHAKTDLDAMEQGLDLIYGVRMREGAHFAVAEFKAVIAELRASRKALIAAAIPLEALNMDNSNGAKWMAPLVKQHVAEAVVAIREALFS